jgi:hypothetical protein
MYGMGARGTDLGPVLFQQGLKLSWTVAKEVAPSGLGASFVDDKGQLKGAACPQL